MKNTTRKKYRVLVNGSLTTEAFNTIQEAMEWVSVFASGVEEVSIETIDVHVQDGPLTGLGDDESLLLG